MPHTELQTVGPAPVAAINIGHLFEKALMQENGVELLERLMKLKATLDEQQAKAAFSRALVKFQMEVPPVPRNAVGKIVTKSGASYSFRYADHSDIVETLLPVAARNGLAFTFGAEMASESYTAILTVRHEEGHREELARITVPTESASSGMAPQHRVAAARTFAERQCLMAGFALALSDPDPEAEAASPVIGTDKVHTLHALIEETHSSLEQFLAHYGVTALGQLRESQYADGVRLLERKRKGGAR